MQTERPCNGLRSVLLALIWLSLGTVSAASVEAAETPVILDQSVSGVMETSAILEATIDPGDGAAYYQFQLGPEREELPSEMLCPLSTGMEPLCAGNQAPDVFPIGLVEGEVQTVALDLAEWAAAGHANTLMPGTPYRFRVVAAPAVDRDDDTIEWEEPTVVGATMWFTTLGSPVVSRGPPLAEPSRPVEVDRPMCRKGSKRSSGNGCCPWRARKVEGKVRCVRPAHLPHFDLLRHPVGLSHLPRALQLGFGQWSPPTDPSIEARPPKLRGGRAYLGESGIYGVGSQQIVCIRALGGPGVLRTAPRGRTSVCVPMSRALTQGIAIVSSCTGRTRGLQIAGLVPNGVTDLGVDRYASGVIEEVVPVKNNVFVLQMERVGVVLHGMGPKAQGFEMKLPLRELSPTCGASGSAQPSDT